MASSLTHMKELDVRDPGGEHGEREEEERDDALPDVDDARRRHGQDDVHPDVGEHRPGGSDEEHVQVLLATHFRRRHRGHADGDDHEEIERGGTDDGVRSEVARFEALRDDLDDGQEDLWGGGT